jgi:alpha-galactosidase
VFLDLSSELRAVDCAVTRIIDFAAPLVQKSGDGNWNDLDMLEAKRLQ